MKPYYYVLNKTQKIAPTYQHKTLEEATTEAERLAEKHPGTAFEILQCIGVSSVPKASTFWMDGVYPESVEINGLDAEIEKASAKFQECFEAWKKISPGERNGSYEAIETNYRKGRRDALTALKESLK